MSKEILTCRRILNVMLTSCFILLQMLRSNISIALVDMTTASNNSSICFEWNEIEKGNILASFFWGYILTAIIGGRLAEIYGTKIVVGTSMFLSSLLTLITPLAAFWNYYVLLVVRAVIGLTVGLCLGSVPPLAMNWVSVNDMSKFLSSTRAVSLGAAIILPIGGPLIVYFGWPSTFYVPGGIGFLWSITWVYLVFDHPDKHPRITKDEKETIQNEIKDAWNRSKSTKVPWLQILTSRPLQAYIIGASCFGFNVGIVMNYLPSYMVQVLHLSVEQTGLFSSLPFLASYISAIVYSYLGDKLIKMKKYQILTIRRTFLVVTLGGPIIFFIIQLLWGQHCTVSVLVFILWYSCNGASVPSLSANSIDLSPNYAGTITGIGHFFIAASGFASTKIVSYIIKEQQNLKQWSYVFWLLICVNTVCTLVFLIFGSADVQEWNFRYDPVSPSENENIDSTKESQEVFTS